MTASNSPVRHRYDSVTHKFDHLVRTCSACGQAKNITRFVPNRNEFLQNGNPPFGPQCHECHTARSTLFRKTEAENVERALQGKEPRYACYGCMEAKDLESFDLTLHHTSAGTEFMRPRSLCKACLKKGVRGTHRRKPDYNPVTGKYEPLKPRPLPQQPIHLVSAPQVDPEHDHPGQTGQADQKQIPAPTTRRNPRAILHELAEVFAQASKLFDQLAGQ
jgi:hypothetical protein